VAALVDIRAPAAAVDAEATGAVSESGDWFSEPTSQVWGKIIEIILEQVENLGRNNGEIKPVGASPDDLQGIDSDNLYPQVKQGPPEFPWLIAASVWTSTLPFLVFRPALMIRADA
jgi:hypothetical protein